MTIQQIHETIKTKLATRTTDQLIADATVARANKEDEAERMVFALIMDTIATRVSDEQFEIIYDQIAI